MEYTGGALKHISMAVVADTENFTKLIEAVKSLTRNNVNLTTQLSNTM